MMRVGIAGGGLMGRLMAHWCAQQGWSVAVREAGPEHPAVLTERAAAYTSAGMLSPAAEMEAGGLPVYEMGLRSMALWPRIHEACGKRFDLQLQGSLLIAHPTDRGSAERILRHIQPAAEHAPQALSHEALAELEPALKPRLAAWLLPHEGHLFPLQALETLKACTPGDWAFDTPVHAVLPGELQSAKGTETFDWVFDCRGRGGHGPTMPVRGVRGEIFTLQPAADTPPLNRPIRLLHPRWRVYLVPRPGGQIVVGATEIESEDRSPPSVQSNLELLSAAFSIMPSLAEARVMSSDVNLRPALPDNLPVVQTEPGLTRINGLFRHGWLLAPALMEDAAKAMACSPA
jgi:glycine oxidase